MILNSQSSWKQGDPDIVGGTKCVCVTVHTLHSNYAPCLNSQSPRVFSDSGSGYHGSCSLGDSQQMNKGLGFYTYIMKGGIV